MFFITPARREEKQEFDFNTPYFALDRQFTP